MWMKCNAFDSMEIAMKIIYLLYYVYIFVYILNKDLIVINYALKK